MISYHKFVDNLMVRRMGVIKWRCVLSEKYMEDGETYTNEYMVKISTHPVITNITQHLLKANEGTIVPAQKTDTELDKIYEQFCENISDAAEKFYGLGAESLNQMEIVQDGLNLKIDLLYQLFPDLDAKCKRIETTRMVNRKFWSEYFYHNGADGAGRIGITDELSIWQTARMFAEEFWKFSQDEFLPTIALGVEVVDQKIREIGDPPKVSD